MFIHIGKDQSVEEKDIVGVFDLENATVSKETRRFLSSMQEQMKTVSLCDDLPKTFVLCDDELSESVYITQLSPAVTLNRTRRNKTLGV
ncbi:MAG: DUF370 domain-containing protein [Clostridia bacterium]|nr:DUF370 domain-containing protein [Clostridia bacterium]